jgi:mRNA-capping enzyme
MMRLQQADSVETAVRKFAKARPPGIYKDHYLAELFKYHHERRWGRQTAC